jgi:hypothetical protein
MFRDVGRGKVAQLVFRGEALGSDAHELFNINRIFATVVLGYTDLSNSGASNRRDRSIDKIKARRDNLKCILGAGGGHIRNAERVRRRSMMVGLVGSRRFGSSVVASRRRIEDSNMS